MGVSKNADVTIVRIPQAKAGKFDIGPGVASGDLIQGYRVAAHADAINKVHEDVLTAQAADSNFKAVVGKTIKFHFFTRAKPNVLIKIHYRSWKIFTDKDLSSLF